MKTMFPSHIAQNLGSLVTTFARGFDATERVLGRAMVLSARLGGDVSGASGGVCWSGHSKIGADDTVNKIISVLHSAAWRVFEQWFQVTGSMRHGNETDNGRSEDCA